MSRYTAMAPHQLEAEKTRLETMIAARAGQVGYKKQNVPMLKASLAKVTSLLAAQAQVDKNDA